MPKAVLAEVPGLEVLKFFKNKDFSVKIFEMMHKFVLNSQKYNIDEKLRQEQKVSWIQIGDK